MTDEELQKRLWSASFLIYAETPGYTVLTLLAQDSWGGRDKAIELFRKGETPLPFSVRLIKADSLAQS